MPPAAGSRLEPGPRCGVGLVAGAGALRLERPGRDWILHFGGPLGRVVGVRPLSGPQSAISGYLDCELSDFPFKDIRAARQAGLICFPPMPDEPSPSVFRDIAIGDRGTIPVRVVKDWGDVLQVENIASGIGGGTIRTLFWVARRDFMPSQAG